MHGVSINRTVPWAVALGAAVLAAVVATNSPGQGSNQPLANGGAREWVASDHPGSFQGLNATKQIVLINTSTEQNSYVVTYERNSAPPRRRICTGTLGAGQRAACQVSGLPPSGPTLGYFQVRSSQPLLPGGYTQVPVRGWEEGTRRVRGRVQGTGRYHFVNTPGVVQHVPYDWQQGCPPKAGSGCPGSSGGALVPRG
jgi:hypothetical protein